MVNSIKKGKCIDCGKVICEVSIRCRKCAKGLIKGLTIEEIYGNEIASKLRKERSERVRGANNPAKRPEVRLKNSLWHKGISPGNKGKKYEDYMSKEKIIKVKEAIKNREWNFSPETRYKRSLYAKLHNPMNKPEIKLKHRKIMDSKEYRENLSIKTSEGIKNMSIEKKEKHKQKHRELWRNENYRKKHLYNSCIKRTTTIEIKIMEFLNELQIDFIHQYFINDIKAKYFCDFYIPKLNLVIECDGNYWHNYPNGTAKDILRNEQLKLKGYKILRIWEKDIRKMKTENLKEMIDNVRN